MLPAAGARGAVGMITARCRGDDPRPEERGAAGRQPTARSRPSLWAVFVDRVRIHVRGGDGGDGTTSFRRQPYEPKGPPEGGDGGDGGDVVLRADAQVATLLDLHHRPHRRAGRGVNGSGDLRHGAAGAHEVLRVPVGTVVLDDESGEVLADLVRDGQEVVVAEGGRGGRGNAAFKTSHRRAPRFHERGVPGEERWVVLELKLIADVALVGFPNAGKSSLVARISAARPKIADYPFTTLAPNLGVVSVDDLDYVVADVPGLIEGAAQGRGLGHRFLRHVERAHVLVHVLDCASGYAADADGGGRRYEQRDPTADLRVVVGELRAYLPQLLDRPALVFLNKVDADADTAELVRPDLEAEGWEVLAGSAATGAGVPALRYRLADLVRAARAAAPTPGSQPDDGTRPVLRPREVRGGRDFSVERVGLGGGEVGWRVHGERIRRWVRQLDLGNPDAVAYLQGRLARAGVEDALAEAGAQPGDDVQIGEAVFTFRPEDLDTWAELEDDLAPADDGAADLDDDLADLDLALEVDLDEPGPA
jgi:GTPase